MVMNSHSSILNIYFSADKDGIYIVKDLMAKSQETKSSTEEVSRVIG